MQRLSERFVHALRFRHLTVPDTEGFRSLFNEHSEAVLDALHTGLSRKTHKGRGLGRVKEVVGQSAVFKGRVGNGGRGVR